MRTRAGIVLIEDGKVALIERHRGGLHYYVFPGGGVDEGETVEQAAVREAMEELGVIVEVQRLTAEIRFDQSTQFYYLVKRTGGEFGMGTGEEFTDSDPADPEEGTYLPIWMPLAELPRHEKVFPLPLARLVLESMTNGFPNEPVLIVEKTK